MSVRRHLTYANVLATVTLFLVLGGGAAIAAGKLAKNSVGTPQLKKGAVTTAKIKRNAVTTAKLRNGAVTAAKIKPGSLTGSDLSASLPYGHIVHTERASSVLPVLASGVLYPLERESFTQEAGSSLVAIGGVEVSIGASCVGPSVYAVILADQPEPLKSLTEPVSLGPRGMIAFGEFESEAKGPLTRRVTLSPATFNAAFGVAPAAPASHKLSLVVEGECSSGSGITVDFGGIDVIANGHV